VPRPIREVPWLETRNGVYNVCWYEPPTAEAKQRNPQAKGQTKRLGLRTRSAAQAQACYAEFLKTGYHKTTADGQLTVAGALEHYDAERVEKIVDKRRARIAKSHLTAFFGATPFSVVGIAECESYAEARRKSGASDSTARRELVVLRAAARHNMKRNRISLDKMPKFEMPPEFDDGQERKWFTKEEFARLLARVRVTAMSNSATEDGRAKRQKLWDFMVLAYWWAARRHSVESLETRQVNLATGHVNLQKAGQQVTNKRRPIVVIYPEQRPVLERLMARAEDGWLFGKDYNAYWVFRGLCEECGFEEGRHNPHMLRHSRATHMLMDGESIYKVAKLLGDTVATVEKVYGHYSPEFLADKATRG
jgi:integrase